MKIGILGAGGIGQAFALHAVEAGFEVVLSNSRSADTLSEVVDRLGPRASRRTAAGTRWSSNESESDKTELR